MKTILAYFDPMAIQSLKENKTDWKDGIMSVLMVIGGVASILFLSAVIYSFL